MSFRVQGLGLKVQGSGCKTQGSGFRVSGFNLGFKCLGFIYRSQRLGSRS